MNKLLPLLLLVGCSPSSEEQTFGEHLIESVGPDTFHIGHQDPNYDSENFNKSSWVIQTCNATYAVCVGDKVLRPCLEEYSEFLLNDSYWCEWETEKPSSWSRESNAADR